MQEGKKIEIQGIVYFVLMDSSDPFQELLQQEQKGIEEIFSREWIEREYYSSYLDSQHASPMTFFSTQKEPTQETTHNGEKTRGTKTIAPAHLGLTERKGHRDRMRRKREVHCIMKIKTLLPVFQAQTDANLKTSKGPKKFRG
jgi:hypothetical protein